LQPDPPIIRLASIDSTNRYCLARAAELPPGSTVVAETQTAGRGRQGRAWHSPPGCNLYASVLFKPPFLPSPETVVPQLGALAVYQAVRDRGVHEVRLKWPNDVCVGHAKLAGVLTESVRAGGNVTAIVLGVGVNLNLDAAACASIDRPATSVRVQTGATVDREAFLHSLLAYLNAGYQQAATGDADEVHAQWRRASRLLGATVLIIDGSRSPPGVVQHLGDDGSLQLRDPTGELHTFRNGEVSLRLVPEATG